MHGNRSASHFGFCGVLFTKLSIVTVTFPLIAAQWPSAWNSVFDRNAIRYQKHESNQFRFQGV